MPTWTPVSRRGPIWFSWRSTSFPGDRIRADLIQSIARRFGLEKILFELPVVILPGVSREYKHRVTAWLVRELGTEVNLANVEWDELWIAVMTRRGAGGDTSHPGGAYRLTAASTAEAKPAARV